MLAVKQTPVFRRSRVKQRYKSLPKSQLVRVHYNLVIFLSATVTEANIFGFIRGEESYTNIYQRDFAPSRGYQQYKTEKKKNICY